MSSYEHIDGEECYVGRCCTCKTLFLLGEALNKAANERAGDLSFYCPNGHTMVKAKGQTDLEKMRQERDRLKQNEAYLETRIREEKERREAAERSAQAYRASATRVKNRAKNGVCPCCNRTFQNLKNHMKTKHPSYQTDADVIDLAKKVRERA